MESDCLYHVVMESPVIVSSGVTFLSLRASVPRSVAGGDKGKAPQMSVGFLTGGQRSGQGV